MRVGYARVSTDDQSLLPQIDALRQFGCELIFSDHGTSGASRARPGLDRMLASLDRDAELVIWRLDRLGRSLSHLVDLVAVLNQRGVRVISISESIDTRSSTGLLVFHIMGALAEFERALISERTRAGMESARQRGRPIGRPRKLADSDIVAAADACGLGETTIAGLATRLGVSPATVSRALRRHGTAAARSVRSSHDRL